MPRYNPLVHTTAKRELERLNPNSKENLIETITEVAELREPTQHDSVRHLKGQPGLFRVREGEVRAICKLDKPDLLVLSVGHRKHVYDGINNITDRLESVA